MDCGWSAGLSGSSAVSPARLTDALYEHGFEGTLSIDHEDPVWRGNLDHIMGVR